MTDEKWYKALSDGKGEEARLANQEITILKSELKQRDETIKQLKEALKWFLPIARWYYRSFNDEKVIQKINEAKQFIE